VAVATNTCRAAAVGVAVAPPAVCKRRDRTAAVRLCAHANTALAALPQPVVDGRVLQVAAEELDTRA
jgi:hypothetical protein